MRAKSATRVAVLTAAVLLLVTASPAAASTLVTACGPDPRECVEGFDEIIVQADDLDNVLTVEETQRATVIESSGAIQSNRCEQRSDRRVKCPLGPRGSADISVSAGAGNDEIRMRNVGALVLGGPGDDELTGGSGSDSLIGGEGSDVAHGQKGDDSFTDEAGHDRVFGGAGDDNFDFDESVRPGDHGGNPRQIASCGRGHDEVVVDPKWNIGRPHLRRIGCEDIKRYNDE